MQQDHKTHDFRPLAHVKHIDIHNSLEVKYMHSFRCNQLVQKQQPHILVKQTSQQHNKLHIPAFKSLHTHPLIHNALDISEHQHMDKVDTLALRHHQMEQIDIVIDSHVHHNTLNNSFCD